VAGQESDAAIERLEDALFDVAEPTPVSLTAISPARVAADAVPPSTAQPRLRAAHRRPTGSRVLEAFEAGPSALLAEPRARARRAVTEVGARLGARGRVLALGGGLAVALTIGAVLLVPSAPTPHSDAPMRTPVPTTARAEATPDAHLMGADPVAATAVLLAARDACMTGAEDRRSACLAAISDGTASSIDLPDRPLAGLAPSLLERTGDTALVALTPKDPKTAPASALLMRTEAGWRLRQLYEN